MIRPFLTWQKEQQANNPMTVTLHGIKNCDSVKKARKWLEAEQIEYVFRDFRETPLSAQEVTGWLDRCGSEVVVNRRSTTWKQLDARDKALADDTAGAATLLVANPTLVKRPVLDVDGQLSIGFKAETYEQLLK